MLEADYQQIILEQAKEITRLRETNVKPVVNTAKLTALKTKLSTTLDELEHQRARNKDLLRRVQMLEGRIQNELLPKLRKEAPL
jgi:peptidoglycan hydrolase CwlO-like protein